jgi:hypothetical protein
VSRLGTNITSKLARSISAVIPGVRGDYVATQLRQHTLSMDVPEGWPIPYQAQELALTSKLPRFSLERGAMLHLFEDSLAFKL